MTIKRRSVLAAGSSRVASASYLQALEGTVQAQQSVIAALKATVVDLQQALRDMRDTDGWHQQVADGFCYRCGEPSRMTDDSGHYVCRGHG